MTKDIAVVIPFYQKNPGVLVRAINSIFAQVIADRVIVIIVDDGSPIAAKDEVTSIQSGYLESIIVIEQSNGGAGSARNTALDNLPRGVEFVAFLDSDDEWFPDHLENAVYSLDLGYDAYFSDHFAALYPDVSNFNRIGTLKLSEQDILDSAREIYGMRISMIDHIVSDGGGVIGTSNVVYRYAKFTKLRFREEFYNGQDFFFWMDLCDQGAKWCFSTMIECRCGQGINIYSGSGWGSEKSLQRLRNELFIWTSVERFYNLSNKMKRANQITIANLGESVVRDLLHRIIRFKPINISLLRNILQLKPGIIGLFLTLPFSIVIDRLRR